MEHGIATGTKWLLVFGFRLGMTFGNDQIPKNLEKSRMAMLVEQAGLRVAIPGFQAVA